MAKKGTMSAQDKHITVLVTAIGGPTGYGIVKCLREVPEVRVIGIDRSPACPTQHMVDEFRMVPSIQDPKYISVVRDIVRERHVDVLFPTLQDELIALSALNDITRVILSSESAISSVLNKAKLYQRLREGGLSEHIPRHFVLREIGSLRSRAEELGYPAWPVCIKPLSGHGGIGFKVIASARDVASRWNSGKGWDWSTLDEAETILGQLSSFEPMLIMEYLPGREYSVDVLSHKGVPRVVVPRRRSRVSTGIVIDGITERREDLISLASAVVEALELDYFSNIQFRYDANGVPKVIDVNPRFCGSQVLSFGAGVNFPLLCIQQALGKEVKVPTPRWGVLMKRYWESVFFNDGERFIQD